MLTQLVKDKQKSKLYIKNCKRISKKQVEQLKAQQKEHKKAVSSIETQSFTTKFHAVAFRVEHEVMKLIGMRRKLDLIIVKTYFERYATSAKIQRIRRTGKITSNLLTLKSACFSIYSTLRSAKFRQNSAFLSILKDPGENHQNSKLKKLCEEKQSLEKNSSQGLRSNKIDKLIRENAKLKEKLEST